jgi:hypothetical protein
MLKGLRARYYVARKLLSSKHRGTSLIEKAIFVVIGLFVAAILLPSAVTSVDTMNTNPVVNGAHVTFNPAVVTVTEVLLPILVIIAVALYFMPRLRGD